MWPLRTDWLIPGKEESSEDCKEFRAIIIHASDVNDNSVEKKREKQWDLVWGIWFGEWSRFISNVGFPMCDLTCYIYCAGQSCIWSDITPALYSLLLPPPQTPLPPTHDTPLYLCTGLTGRTQFHYMPYTLYFYVCDNKKSFNPWLRPTPCSTMDWDRLWLPITMCNV